MKESHSINIHIENDSPMNQMIRCLLCNETFLDRLELKLHGTTAHPTPENEDLLPLEADNLTGNQNVSSNL